MNTNEKTRPRVAAVRVARLRSPVMRHAIDLAMRPPSSGKAGIRLNDEDRPALIEAIHASTATKPLETVPVLVGRARRNSSAPPTSAPTATQRIAIPSVTRGPATATLNSVPGESESRSSLARPPKIHSVMLEMEMPRRRATNACPSSWRRIEPKKPNALTTARP